MTLKHLPAGTAAELAALPYQTVKFDPSPFILSPFEAERKPAGLDRTFIGLHVISARRGGEL